MVPVKQLVRGVYRINIKQRKAVIVAWESEDRSPDRTTGFCMVGKLHYRDVDRTISLSVCMKTDLFLSRPVIDYSVTCLYMVPIYIQIKCAENSEY
jgi:hypothetical protein